MPQFGRLDVSQTPPQTLDPGDRLSGGFQSCGPLPTYHIGLMAQDVGKTTPQAVVETHGYKAVEYLEKSVRIGPTNALAHVHLAEAYLAVNRKDDAQKQLAALIAMKPDPDFVPEHNEALLEARKLQAQLN